MRKELIRVEDLYPGARVTLYSWQNAWHSNEGDVSTPRQGVVEKILRNGRMIIIRMDHGYTECWHPKELFLALNGIRSYAGYVSTSAEQEVRDLICTNRRAMEDMEAYRGVPDTKRSYPGGVSGWNVAPKGADDDI